ncbi:MAG: DnaB-like helicase C-terminal domain-containing protein [bacterium]
MKFAIEFEEEVLARSIRDVMYLKKASRVLDAHHFGTKHHSWVWKQIRDIWDTYREPTTGKMLLVRAKRDFPDKDDRKPYLELCRKLLKLKPKAAASALDELSKFVRAVNAQLALEKAATALEKDKLDEVYDTMRQVGERDLKPREYTRVKWIEGFEERQAERKHRREHPEEYVSIPTGMARLDRIITGIQIGELGLVLGTTGRGKSIMLTNLAYYAVSRGYPTAYFAFEMPARQIAMRQDARWLQMPYRKFKEYDFSPSELRGIKARLDKMRPRFSDKFQIFSMPVRSADINAVRQALDDARIEDGFKPQLLLFDSADHLLPTGRSESFRLDQANVYWGCKGLAEEDGYAIWSSTQAGKEFATRTATAEAASESYDKGRIADIMVSLNEPRKHSRATKVLDEDDDEDDDEETMAPTARGKFMELYLAKYRDGASKLTIPLDAELEKMLISEIGPEE